MGVAICAVLSVCVMACSGSGYLCRMGCVIVRAWLTSIIYHIVCVEHKGVACSGSGYCMVFVIIRV